MTIEEILQALPSKDDLVKAVGLQARSSGTGELLAALGIFGTGVVLGAGLALLLAPKSGRETRHDIAERVGELSEHLRVTVPEPAPATESSDRAPTGVGAA